MSEDDRMALRLRHLSAWSYTKMDDGSTPFDEILRATLNRLDKIIEDVPMRFSRKSDPQVSNAATVQSIALLVCQETGATIHQIRSPSRSRLITEARHVAMYVARRCTRESFTSIARYYKRNHSTVSYGCGVIRQARKNSKTYKAWIERLVKMGVER